MTGRILVTGGRGTLGRRVVDRLARDGYGVRIASRRPRPEQSETALGPEVEWAQATLESDAGWAEAVAGVDTVVHAASAPFQKGVDAAGTRRLLHYAAQAGVNHIVYISIVGVQHRDWFYFDAKYQCEQLIQASGLPFSILRTTQFHDFAHLLLRDMFMRLPVGLLPRGWRLQTIDTGEAADLLVQAVREGPGGHLPEAGGPEILPFKEMADVWMAALGRKPVLQIPFPFLMNSAYATGHNLTPDRRVGRLTWREWVAANLAAPAASGSGAQGAAAETSGN